MKLKLAIGSFTRPANATAYAVGDLVANNFVAGSVAAAAIAAASVQDGRGRIARVALLNSTAVVLNAQFRIHLFNHTPAVGAGDNVALAITNGRARGYPARSTSPPTSPSATAPSAMPPARSYSRRPPLP
ncbi:hypothetical protein FHS96_001287 [Sphingomonas zeicaulis]|uniref:hypothetical protein n=1 Tax=Sphingomonas zeicaulis TaxID=1632740 RepID=UPI003D22CDBA